MNQAFQAVQVTDRVFWVGAIDWGIRNFHGYETSRGTTYNAFLIVADQIVLVDTVKSPFQDEMLARIASVVEPSKIDTIISNHTEMDHSGSLPKALEVIRPKRLIASAQGAKALGEHFHWDQPVQVVSDGEKIELGKLSLRFFETRMLHWPDSMFTYLVGDRVLFSNDAFGMHLASSQRFADQLDPSLCQYEAAKYYANILLPFSALVTGLLAKLPKLDLDVHIIAPDHGPLYRRQPGKILELYAKWAAQRPSNKAVVLYDTMWQSTAKMARAITDGLASSGVSTQLLPLEVSHRSDVATQVLDAGALVVGSPTMNNQVFPSLADAMTYLKGLKPKNLVGAAFGSYGWSGEAVRYLEQMLQEMGVELVQPGLRVKYRPDAETLMRCRSFGADLAARMAERFSLEETFSSQ